MVENKRRLHDEREACRSIGKEMNLHKLHTQLSLITRANICSEQHLALNKSVLICPNLHVIHCSTIFIIHKKLPRLPLRHMPMLQASASDHQAWWPPLTRMLQGGESTMGCVLFLELTYSLPVQKVDASLANHAITPRSSSGRPIRPIGFKLDHLSRRCGSLSRYAAVILTSYSVSHGASSIKR